VVTDTLVKIIPRARSWAIACTTDARCMWSKANGWITSQRFSIYSDADKVGTALPNNGRWIAISNKRARHLLGKAAAAAAVHVKRRRRPSSLTIKLRKTRLAQERRAQERERFEAAMQAYQQAPSVLIKKSEAQ
jgi:hypothetical protein